MAKFGSLKAQMVQGVIPKGEDSSQNDKQEAKGVVELTRTTPLDVVSECNNDFRGITDPTRTLKRMNFVLRHKDLTPIMRVATALLVQEFYGNDEHRKQIIMSELFPVSEGYTNRTRIETLAKLEALGLIKKSVIHSKGQDITLLF